MHPIVLAQLESSSAELHHPRGPDALGSHAVTPGERAGEKGAESVCRHIHSKETVVSLTVSAGFGMMHAKEKC